MKTKKFTPNVGDQLYLRQFTGDFFVDIVKTPYTVVATTPTKITVQEAKLIFPVFKFNPKTMDPYYQQYDGKRVSFYNTVAESIEPDLEGRLEDLVWHPKRGLWGTSGPDSDYPEYAIFGEGYKHNPYLN